MADDVILDAMASYITSDQESLSLALRVEAAMPRVRERLIGGVLEGVKRHFSAPDYAVIESDGKDILAPQHLTLRKQSWTGNLEDSDQSTGIRWGTTKRDWGNVYIGLYLDDAVIEKLQARDRLNDDLKRLRQYNDDNYPLKWDGWNELGNLRDWSCGEFLEQTRSASNAVVGELACWLEKWLSCPTVEEILSVVKRSHAE